MFCGWFIGREKKGNFNCPAFLSPIVQSSIHEKPTPLHLIVVFIQKLCGHYNCHIPFLQFIVCIQVRKWQKVLETAHAVLPGQVTHPSSLEILSSSHSTPSIGNSYKICVSDTAVTLISFSGSYTSQSQHSSSSASPSSWQPYFFHLTLFLSPH